jgi:FAD/FMN-containing dehydrogenase
MSTITVLAGAAIAWAFALINRILDPPLSCELTFSSELSRALSSNGQICSPGSACYTNATSRWLLDWGAPHFDIVIRPTTQADVENTIKLANKYGKPFLAISGGHGASLTLSKLTGGVGIWMEAFKEIEIEETTASIGGGITSGELRDKLLVEGKQTVTGACDCTGAVAPMLGGGHGWLQGRYVAFSAVLRILIPDIQKPRP